MGNSFLQSTRAATSSYLDNVDLMLVNFSNSKYGDDEDPPTMFVVHIALDPVVKNLKAFKFYRHTASGTFTAVSNTMLLQGK